MDLIVFYSWQSDRPETVCRYLIRDAAKKAVARIAAESTIDDSPRLDHDTKGQSGIPAIADTIFSKIEKAAIFIADVTFVGESDPRDADSKKKVPNPNMLVELGYAAKAIGWDRIVCVFNEFYGSIDEQIFNLRHRRNAIVYRLDPDDRDSTTSQRDQLSAGIENAFRSVLRAEHHGVDQILAQLDAYSQTFLRMYAATDIITPRPTNEFRLGVPANDLDTPGYNAAVSHLRQLGVIRAVTDPSSHSIALTWTYMGYMVLTKLGLRSHIPGEAC